MKMLSPPMGYNRTRISLLGATVATVALAYGFALASTDPAGNAPLPVVARSVPAEYLKDLSPPGAENHFKRPAALLADRNFDEVLVADPGNNRILIFDGHGTFRFEFDCGDRISSPSDLAVDSEGFIFVLGVTTRGKRVFRFDFDGLFLGEVPTPAVLQEQAVDLRSLAIDRDDRLYLLDHAGLRVLSCDGQGDRLRVFPLDPGVAPDLRQEIVLGRLAIAGDRIFVPIASMGTVQVYDRSGVRRGSVGHMGTHLGELNFPVAVAVTAGNLVLVLDKHRFNVQCYDPEGRFLGEFGGKGSSPGWFYHPSLLAVDRQDQVYVGQIFQNKVQVCRLPDFIRDQPVRGGREAS